MPMISIVTPVFNGKDFIVAFLERIKSQSYSDFELIIVDDKSSDGSVQLIQSFLDEPRFQLLCLPQNGGAAAARNAGLERARGNYVCFLDIDDAWHPDKLKLQLEFMQEQCCGLSYMDYRRVDASGQLLSEVIAPECTDFASMLKSNHIGNLTAMVRRDLTDQICFRNIGHEDYVFWLEILRRIPRALKVPLPETMCFYRVHGGSLSSNKLKAAGWQWRIYRRDLGLGWFRSAWYMCHYAAISVAKRL